MSSFIDTFVFLRPWWLLALLVLPCMWWLLHRRSKHLNPWRRICDPHLLIHLSEAAPSSRQPLANVLLSLGLVISVVALAGPSYRFDPQPVVKLQSPLIVAVDLSERMNSTDLKPSRMSRVRFKLADLLARRKDGQVALIAYAGDAFTVAPLTDDATSLSDLAGSLSPEIMPLQGQRSDRAIVLAQKLLSDGGFVRGELLVMSDSVDERGVAAAKVAAQQGLMVSVLGVGTEQGAPIPKLRGGFVMDKSGAILIPRLERSNLRQMASAGGGHYADITVDDSDLLSLGVATARVGWDDSLKESDQEQLARRDEGPMLLLILLPLAALAFRRGWLGCILVLAMVPTQPAQAFDWGSLWQRADQRAWQALREGDAERARDLAKDPALLAEAAYKLQDYDTAIEHYSKLDSATGNYNLGNALAQAGRYEEALAAFDQALAKQPDFSDAKENRDAIEELLKQQEQQSESSEQGDDDSESSEEGEDDSKSGQQSDSGESSETESDSSSDDSVSEEGESKSEGQSEGEEESQAASSSEDGREGEPDSQAMDELENEQSSEAQQFSDEMQQALEATNEQARASDEQAGLTTEEMEKQQAMEHLLQRVPDDPGGLLRRKFQLELQRRQQEGSYR